MNLREGNVFSHVCLSVKEMGIAHYACHRLVRGHVGIPQAITPATAQGVSPKSQSQSLLPSNLQGYPWASRTCSNFFSLDPHQTGTPSLPHMFKHGSLCKTFLSRRFLSGVYLIPSLLDRPLQTRYSFIAYEKLSNESISGSMGRAQGTHVHLFLSFSCSFREQFDQIIGWRPTLWGRCSPSEKSWISH